MISLIGRIGKKRKKEKQQKLIDTKNRLDWWLQETKGGESKWMKEVKRYEFPVIK